MEVPDEPLGLLPPGERVLPVPLGHLQWREALGATGLGDLADERDVCREVVEQPPHGRAPHHGAVTGDERLGIQRPDLLQRAREPGERQ